MNLYTVKPFWLINCGPSNSVQVHMVMLPWAKQAFLFLQFLSLLFCPTNTKLLMDTIISLRALWHNLVYPGRGKVWMSLPLTPPGNLNTLISGSFIKKKSNLPACSINGKNSCLALGAKLCIHLGSGGLRKIRVVIRNLVFFFLK